MNTNGLMKSNKTVVCNNCGKYGHQFHQCKSPITSYGVIVFRKHPINGIEYLMIRRKNSFGYIDFIRGKYVSYNLDHLQQLIDEMSESEKQNILTQDFSTLCSEMWGDNQSMWRSEDSGSQRKFENLKNIGITMTDNSKVFLKDIVGISATKWQETEWEFPKGRRNTQEKEIDCAVREFVEETGYSKHCISVLRNIIPIEEIFIGSNHKSYKHKYYLAYMDNNQTHSHTLHNFQQTEVSKIEWKTLPDCLHAIRPYNTEKKRVLININKLISEYTLKKSYIPIY